MMGRLSRRAAAMGGVAAAVAGPWLGLGVRLWLAQIFLAAQVHDMMLGRNPTSSAWGGALHGLMTSDPGLVVQALCPALLAVGLLARPAALAMLLQAWLMPPDPVVAGFVALLLLRTVLLGAGPLSLDWLLLRGADSLAVPGAAGVVGALQRRRAVLLAGWLLGMRVGVAASLLAGGMPMMQTPAMITGLPRWMAMVAAGLLVTGAGTRLVALVLLVLTPLGGLGGADPVAGWALLLGLMLTYGGGAWSADAVLGARLGRGAAAAPGGLPHVVVVGGGFGGVAAVLGLRHAPCRVTLVDQRNHHLFQPLLYQVATAGLSPGDIATPIRALFRGQDNVRVVLARVTGVDCAARTVQLDHGVLEYDHLVLATGAQHGYFGRDAWAAVAPGLKTLDDATAIRRRLLLAFEAAEDAGSAAEREAWLTFVIVGGGPTGVELAGAIAELARHGMTGEFRSIDPARARVVLVQSAARLLPAFPESLSRNAAEALVRLGVEVRLGAKVEEMEEGGVTISGEVLPARTVLWAAGVMASPAAAWLGVAADRAGRVPVGPDLTPAGCPGVLVVGDTAASLGWRGKEVPGLAPAAKQGGAYAARVIRARLAGRAVPGPFRYRHAGSLATIGRQSAVADFGAVRVRGALAWWLWGAAHVAFLVGGRNRAVVIVQWLWAYLTYRRGTRLITGPPP